MSHYQTNHVCVVYNSRTVKIRTIVYTNLTLIYLNSVYIHCIMLNILNEYTNVFGDVDFCVVSAAFVSKAGSLLLGFSISSDLEMVLSLDSQDVTLLTCLE